MVTTQHQGDSEEEASVKQEPPAKQQDFPNFPVFHFNTRRLNATWILGRPHPTGMWQWTAVQTYSWEVGPSEWLHLPKSPNKVVISTRRAGGTSVTQSWDFNMAALFINGEWNLCSAPSITHIVCLLCHQISRTDRIVQSQLALTLLCYFYL